MERIKITDYESSKLKKNKSQLKTPNRVNGLVSLGASCISMLEERSPRFCL